MLLALAIPVLLLAPALPRSTMPAGASQRGLMELARDGEVILLPVHDRRPFNAVLSTRSNTKCNEVAKSMMDVEGWPKRYSISEAKVLERTPTKVSYELHLSIALAPAIRGTVENPSPGHIVFHDPETGADFIWTLTDDPLGCHMSYSMVEAPDKVSGFVAIVRAIEKSAGDAANMAAALSSARGYSKPDADQLSPRGITAEGEKAWTAMASHGIAIRVLRAKSKFPRILIRRRVDKSADEVLAAIRDRASYEKKIDSFKSVNVETDKVRWSIGFFGGGVNFETASKESGTLTAADGVRIEERVLGGDLRPNAGTWTWTVRRAARS